MTRNVTFKEFYKFLDNLVNDLCDLHGDIWDWWKMHYMDDYYCTSAYSQEEVDILIRFIIDCEDYIDEVYERRRKREKKQR